MGWILLFGPIVSGVLITLLQLAIYRLLLLARIIKQEQMPIPPVMIMRSFLILIVLFAILYFNGYMNGFIEPLDPTKPPEGTKMHEEMQRKKARAEEAANNDAGQPDQAPATTPEPEQTAPAPAQDKP